MTRQRLLMLRTAWASFALGTLVSLTLNAGVTGCSTANHQHVESPSAAEEGTTVANSAPPESSGATTATPKPGLSGPTAEDCMPRFMGATKAAPVLAPGCERPRPAEPSNQGLERAPRQTQ